VSRQQPDTLFAELAKGRTLLSVTANGQGRLVMPTLKPDASRKHRLMVAALDLARVKDTVTRRIGEMAARWSAWAGETKD
jgi:hypothetical protein